jgi:hypothetical protein
MIVVFKMGAPLGLIAPRAASRRRPAGRRRRLKFAADI